MADIQLGLSISTAANEAADPVGTARYAESLGFDFVSASDHPGGSDPTYETWTLLSWIAASTSRIGIASRVLCGPLRLPALTAKMAETLQRLSNGRLILGLGAGSSDQEMHSFGIDPPTAGAKVTGLEEAVRIIQALWTEPAVTFAGRLQRVNDARIEPKPDQPIPVWLGAFGDRALDLTGRLADGWIPSYGYTPPRIVVVMRDKVLAAAETAGRDPGAVTCAYHLNARIGAAVPSSEVVSGSVAQVTEQLIALVGLGFTAFSVSLVGPGRRDQAAALAHEVMPAVRAAV